MEDRAVALRLPSGELYAAVFDGHCGEGAPEYCKNHLHSSRPSSHPNPVPQEPRAPEPPPSPPRAKRVRFTRPSFPLSMRGLNLSGHVASASPFPPPWGGSVRGLLPANLVVRPSQI